MLISVFPPKSFSMNMRTVYLIVKIDTDDRWVSSFSQADTDKQISARFCSYSPIPEQRAAVILYRLFDLIWI